MLHPIVSQLAPNEEQEPAVAARGCDVAVTAGAGAGKTLTLVARYLCLLADGCHPRQIAAVTFTRKAARQMRSRVRSAIADYLRRDDLRAEERREWIERYSQLDAARIGTIHSLCTEILRAHPAEAGVDPHFTVLDEGDATLLRQQAVEEALAMAADDERLVKLFTSFGERGLRETLSALLEQRLESAHCFDRLPPEPLLFWRRQLHHHQSEVLRRLLDSDRWCSHVATIEQNQALDEDDLAEQQRRTALFALNDATRPGQSWQASRDALAGLDDINLRGGRQGAWPGGKEQLAEVKEALKGLRKLWRAEADLLQLELNEGDRILATCLPLLQTLFRQASGIYRHFREERQALDFDDLEALAISLLLDPAISRRWQDEICAILVDEYQDTNGRQRDLINQLNGDGGKLFIVGDAKQSIYRFRGADVTVFRSERSRIGNTGRTFKLTTSYRAHAPLLSALNLLLEPVLGTTERLEEPWREPFTSLRHHRLHPIAGLDQPFIELQLCLGTKADGALEHAAQVLAEKILKLVEGAEGHLTYGDVAILCRASTSFAAYETALDQAAVPYLTVAGRGFYERPEVRDLLNALQAIADPGDDLALVGLLRSPVCGFSDADIYRLWLKQQKDMRSLWQTLLDQEDARCSWIAALISTLHMSAGRVSVADLLKAFLDSTDYRAALRSAQQKRALRNVSKLLALAHTSGIVSVTEFLAYVRVVRSSANREGEARATAENAVQIMTVHQAKGLEFPVVVLGDITYSNTRSASLLLDPTLGLVVQPRRVEETPAILHLAQSRDRSQEQAESERLLYVAATRARDKLLLNGTVGMKKDRRLSSFSGWLKELAAPLQVSDLQLDFDGEGSESREVVLQVGDQPLLCTVYEPGYKVSVRAPTSTRAPLNHPRWRNDLIGKLTGRDEARVDEEASPLWRVLPSQERVAPHPAIVGALVHEALAVWRFPASDTDHEFAAWLRSRAEHTGLVSLRQIEAAVQQGCTMLWRFFTHPLYREINRADRRLHEVPFVMEDEAGFHQGRIDLLFQEGTRWTLVEFKTDEVINEAEIYKRHRQQMQRYIRAVTRLQGTTPRPLFCLLNYRGRIHVIDGRGPQ